MPNFGTHHNRLYFERKGQGDSIILLRGLGRSSRYWLGFDVYLSKYFDVITIDQRGLGQSQGKMSWFTSIQDLAEDLKNLVVDLELNRTNIFGLSLGGMVALSFASQFPNLCKSVVVANSSSADYLSLRINPLSLWKILSSIPAGSFDERLHEILVSEKSQQSLRGNRLKAWASIREIEGIPWMTVMKQLFAAARFRIQPRLIDSKIPVAIVAGSDDLLVPKINSQKLAKLVSHSIYYELASAGHELSTEDHYEAILEIIQITRSKIQITDR